MLLKKVFFILSFLVLLFSFSTTSLAQNYDPFAEKEDDSLDTVDTDKDEGKTFTGSIERLLDLAGEKKAGVSPGNGWGAFEKEDPEVARQREVLNQARMYEDSKKPIPQKPAFNSDLDSLRKDLEIIRPTNKREEDYLTGKTLRKGSGDSSGSGSMGR